MRFCTSHLKVEPIRRHGRHIYGFDKHTAAIGIRADEWRRATKMMQSCARREKLGEYIALPLVDDGVREKDVLSWWKKQPFDLAIPSEAGNCTLCFLKGRNKLMRLMRANPSLADWWIAQEEVSTAKTPSGRRFKSNPNDTYRKMRREALAQSDFLVESGADEDAGDCVCTD